MTRLAVRRRFLLVAVVVACLSVVGTATILGATLLRHGAAVTAVRTVNANDFVTTSTSTWVDVPGMSTTVTVPSGQKALLLITYSAETLCGDNGPLPTVYCQIRVLVDGSVVSPGQVIFDSAGLGAGSPVTWHTASMQWIRSGLGVGQHTVKVQWQLDEPDGFFYANARTLTVLRSVQ